MEPEDSPEHDPFEDIAFDDDFVNRALIREPSAEERRQDYRQFYTPPEPIHVRRRWIPRKGVRQPHIYRPKRENRHGIRGLVVLVCLAIALHTLYTPRTINTASIWTYSPSKSEGRRRLIEVPTPRKSESSTPLGVPLAPSPNDDSYRFVFLQDDGVTPVTYDPCRPIHVVTNNRTAPPYGPELVAESLDEISRITGLVFILEGETDEAPTSNRSPYMPERYGDRWAPVLIAWSDPAETPDLEGLVTGIGGSSNIASSDQPTVTYVSGVVILDGPQLEQSFRYGAGREAVKGVILHELGHLVGLNHVDDKSQLMYERAQANITSFQDGDITGLIELGAGPCIPRL